MISKGMLDQARELARSNMAGLYDFARQGIPIVGCEPSCLLTLRDEYPEFVPEEQARVVAENSFLIDEFLARAKSNDRLDLTFKDVDKRVLFHGHCHQKAMVGTEHSLAALRLVPGYEVELINAGCCGMAGSFGFEKEHYDISMQIGGLALFPSIESKPDWEVAVMGVSCRQQVEHGTGRKARHLVEILRDAVA
jgi:Fe-S oxidoreductase